MGKEIKISIKDIDKLEFYLDEDAQKGDWICLKADWTNLKETLELKKEEIIDGWKKQILPELKKQIINEYQLHDQQYLQLLEKARNLEGIQEKNKQEIKYATSILEEKNKSLSSEIEAYKAKEEKNKAEFQNKLTAEIKNHEKEIVEGSALYKELENQNKDLIDKNNVLTAANNSLIHSQKNTKWIGEQLEQWIYGEWEDKLSVPLGTTASFVKATDNIKDPTIDEKDSGTKPDFIFSVYHVRNVSNPNDPKDKKQIQELLEKVVVEAKNESLETAAKNHTKNSEFFKKLDDDREKNEAKFAVLVTELEKDKDFSIALPDPINYPNMFMVRPEWLMSLLSLLYYIINKEAEINSHIKKNEKLQGDKEKLRNKFEVFRTKIMETNLKNIKNQLEKINEYADAIKKNADNIKESRRIIIETHIHAIETRIAKFNIETMCKKIDKINKLEDSLIDDDDFDEENDEVEEIESSEEE